MTLIKLLDQPATISHEASKSAMNIFLVELGISINQTEPTWIGVALLLNPINATSFNSLFNQEPPRIVGWWNNWSFSSDASRERNPMPGFREKSVKIFSAVLPAAPAVLILVRSLFE